MDPRYLLDLDGFFHSGVDIGKFRDVGHLLGINRFNQAGGGIMDDFDGDGLLDIVVTTMDPAGSMAIYHNKGDGTFEDRSEAAGVTDQLGGLVCYQTDYNNDGRLDVFIPRGAWLPHAGTPIALAQRRRRPLHATSRRKPACSIPFNSNAAAWADYDNDGWLDLFVACEKQPNRLYHNRRDGTFEEVAAKAGVDGKGQDFYKGCTWIDYDNDRYPDLFVNCMSGLARLYHNERDGSFSDVTGEMGIDGPRGGFACWSWDYDNDGWLDIFATSYDRSLNDVVRGLVGRKHAKASSRLFHNQGGKGFENRIEEAGLDMVFSAMGCNFGDFDNDGWLDFYLGTGDPDLGTLVPNRMFKNIGRQPVRRDHRHLGHRPPAERPRRGLRRLGQRRRRRHLHRDGRCLERRQISQHHVPEPRPGEQLAHGQAGRHQDQPRRHRRADQGRDRRQGTAHDLSSHLFRQQLRRQPAAANDRAGQGRSRRRCLQIDWPTSGTTQVFRDIPANQSIEITELETTTRRVKARRDSIAQVSDSPVSSCVRDREGPHCNRLCD